MSATKFDTFYIESANRETERPETAANLPPSCWILHHWKTQDKSQCRTFSYS